jgi:hypothetical protein
LLTEHRGRDEDTELASGGRGIDSGAIKAFRQF